jgi:hypothetical protein
MRALKLARRTVNRGFAYRQGRAMQNELGSYTAYLRAHFNDFESNVFAFDIAIKP